MLDPATRKMNLMKGLILEHVSPEKLITFLQHYPENTRFEFHPKITDDNCLFYIMRNIEHVKKWQQALACVFPMSEWNRVNEKGNNVFLEAIEYRHLKAAKAIAASGVEINQVNHQGQNFADILLSQVKENFLKRKWYSYLLFVNSFMENQYPVALNVQNMESIRSFVCLSEQIFKNNKKMSIYGYEPYWDDIIGFSQEIKQKLDFAQANAQRRVLDESLEQRPMKKRMKI